MDPCYYFTAIRNRYVPGSIQSLTVSRKKPIVSGFKAHAKMEVRKY